MEDFLGPDFLLNSAVSKKLYHEYAENMPIADCHSSLSPRMIAENETFSNITQMWIDGAEDNRCAMRACGCDEKYITGNGSDYEKFREFCRIMPYFVGNAAYCTANMELARYFDCKLAICAENCLEIWNRTAEKLMCDGMTVRNIIRKSNIKVLCTRSGPAESLEYYEKFADTDADFCLLPVFFADDLFDITHPESAKYFEELGEVNGVKITDTETLERALSASLDRFEALGMREADCVFDGDVGFAVPDAYHAGLVLKKVLNGDAKNISQKENAVYSSFLMKFLTGECKRRGIVTNIRYMSAGKRKRLLYRLTPCDAGFENLRIFEGISGLMALLNYLDERDALPRTVIFPENSEFYGQINYVCRNLCPGDGHGYPTVAPGLSQNSFNALASHFRTYAGVGALGKHLGLTDSGDGVFSYTRHEYFRRTLCRLVGECVENGSYPYDEKTLEKIIKDICYRNTVNFFGFCV